MDTRDLTRAEEEREMPEKRDIWKEPLRPLTPAEQECYECDGHGFWERIVGSRYCSGLGGPYEPIIKDDECEECDGTGQKVCSEHGQEEVACWVDEPSEVLCEACLEELGTSLEEVKREVIQRAAQDPMIQMSWGREPT